jgi:MoaA/NifB/PqqE/SkfB family radical SAM enzyme
MTSDYKDTSFMETASTFSPLATDKARNVSNAHFFMGDVGRGTVSYMLNEGYCNISCPHCYVNRVHVEPRRRDPQQAEADILALQAEGYNVILRGTELIIHRDFLPLFAVVKQDYVQTNGLYIVKHPDVLDRLWEVGVRYIVITYPFDPDGMIDMDCRDSDQAIALSAERFGVTVSIIVTRNVTTNLASLIEFCDHVRALGARGVKFVRLIPVTPDLLPLTPSPSESKAALEEISRLKKHYAKEELNLQTPGCFGLFEFRRSLEPERFETTDLSDIYDCPGGIKNFVVDLKNDVYPCLYVMGPEHKIGKFSRGKLILEESSQPIGRLRSCECPAYEMRMHLSMSDATTAPVPDGLIQIPITDRLIQITRA